MAALAETVVLQQGVSAYHGCSATTLWDGPIPQDATVDTALYLRGAHNRVLLRFDLPAELRGKRLARARLEVFVPAVKHLRMICEIEAREVMQPWDQGLALDTATDYHRGRAAGAVDSYSLWEYDGQWFPHKYRHLGVPEGGKWIDFNLTPLVRKWLADPDRNYGLALVPLDLGDTRFPNTAETDVPSPTHSEVALRPRLVLEFAPLAQPYLVGATHTLERVCDLDTRYRYFGPFEDHYRLALARNEFEGFQLLVYSLQGDLKGVTLECSDLVDPHTGAVIPKSDLAWFPQHVFPALNENGKIKDWYFHGRNFAVPDPLLPAQPTDVPEHLTTPFWCNVRTRSDTPAGEYHGAITAKPGNAPARELQLTVQVWDYAIPEPWNFQTMGQTVWEYVEQVYGEITPALRRQFIDFLMDHRFNPTEQYRDVLSPSLEDLPYVLSRGGNTIYLSGNFTGDPTQLKQRYDAVKHRGLIDMALVYIGDETSDWEEMRRRSDAIRKVCPELMIMIGGSYPREELEGVIDIFDPQISAEENQVYSLTAESMKPLVAKAQARGERFFWYVAAGPMLPCPNVQIEEPLIASRVLFWLTWKFGVTGFEYYCYNIWSHNLPQEGKRFPEIPLSPHGWGDTNGDGMLFYPGAEGPLSSVRFENIRDGVEDWETHCVLRDYVEALRAKAVQDSDLAAEATPLLGRADALLAVPDAVCQDFVHWTWEPDVLLTARQKLGDTIEAMTKLVSEEEVLAVRAARQAADLARQRRMLLERAGAAR